MPGGMEFEFSTRGPGSAEPLEARPFRLLLLGHYGTAGAGSVADAPVRRVDIDNLDELWEHFAPRLELDVNGVRQVFEPRDLEDFHPDRLCERLPAFDELRALRRRLLDPSTAGDALEEVMTASKGVKPQAPATKPAGKQGESGDELVKRLLGERPATAPEETEPARGLQSLILGAVAPHVVQDEDPRAEAAVNSVDLGLASLMRGVLADPGFRTLEGRWRALYRLVQNVETDETLEIRVGNVSRTALLDALPTSAESLEDSGLHGLLVARHRVAADDHPPSLVAIDDVFGDTPDDQALLGTLGTLAEATGGCVLAGAAPALVGADGVAALGDHRSWARENPGGPLWATLRQAPFAARIGLVLPRLLGRLPYGEDTDPVRAFDFEEMPAHDPDGFLWTCPVPQVCELLLTQYRYEGWAMDPGAGMDVEELPVFSYREDGESRMQPVTEQLMPESAVETALARGVMPLAGYRSQDRARLVRFQSIAEPLRALAGPWDG